MNHNLSDNIDVVITWVNGNDPAHIKKRTAALQDVGKISSSQLITGHHKTRFIYNGELEWCVKSIRKFAPWVQNIYLVTDHQIPDFLNDQNRTKYGVTIIDHTEVFRNYEWALPTFNTRSIESVLWRIPDLSEKFIYFNDDFVITSPLKKEQFFINGKVVVRGRWRRITNYGKLRMQFQKTYSKIIKKLFGVTHSMHLLLQIKSAQLAGLNKKYYYVPHVPHPVQKSTLENFFLFNPQLIDGNIKYKFRDTNQFSAIFLSYHLEITNNRAELLTPERVMMINGEIDFSPALTKKLHSIEKGEVDFLCIQGMELIKQKQKKHLMKTLSALTEN